MTVHSCPRCETFNDSNGMFCLICGYDFAQLDSRDKVLAASSGIELPKEMPCQPVFKEIRSAPHGLIAERPSLILRLFFTVISYGFAIFTPDPFLRFVFDGYYNWDDPASKVIGLSVAALSSMLFPFPIWGKRMIYPVKSSAQPMKLLWVIPFHFGSAILTFCIIFGLTDAPIEPLSKIVIPLVVYLLMQLPIVCSK